MTLAVLAPAKINLGLEVVRKRADGFHDIATVFQTISVFDRLRLTETDSDSVQITNRIQQIESNLVLRALEMARDHRITDRSWRVDLHKRIPVAAGLGGASSDAAATLLALAPIEHIPPEDLTTVALQLGSDVPFLLRGGAAIAGGRGELLEPLPSLTSSWIVLAAPSIELEQKTARLYAALHAGDFSDGSRMQRVAASLRARRKPNPDDLANAFGRPLAALLPAVELLQQSFARAGAPFVALSGAGPAHYTIVPQLADALWIASELAISRPLPMRVLIARPCGAGPLIRL